MKKEDTRRQNVERKKQEKRGLFVILTRKASNKEIDIQEALEGRKLTRAERRKIIEVNARRAMIKTILIGGVFAFGTKAGWEGRKLLEEGKTEISIDAEQYKDGINLTNVTSDRDVFMNGLHVELDEIDSNEKIEQSAKETVDNFKTSEDVLEYTKGIYEEEYFQEYGKNIEITSILKNPSDLNESIIRICGKVKDETEDNRLIEEVKRSLKGVENADPISNSRKDVLLKDNKAVYDIIAVGCEYASTFDKNLETNDRDYYFLDAMEGSWKDSYIEYLIEYKKEQRNKIASNNKNETIQDNEERY